MSFKDSNNSMGLASSRPKYDKDKLFAANRKIQEESQASSSDGGSFHTRLHPRRGGSDVDRSMSMGTTDLEKSMKRVEKESFKGKVNQFKKKVEKKKEKHEIESDDESFDDDDGMRTGSLRSGEGDSVVDYDIDVKLREDEKPNLILYKYRWVVLFAFFLTSAATGAVQGSLSTNRAIIDKIDNDMDKEQLDWAKYSDLVLYLPMNFTSIWLIENYGLKKCISLGSIIMIIGSVMRLMSSFGSIWWWFVGHIVCMSGQAYLKNPVTKLASNWFGDKERGLATAIGIVSGPLGIFVIQTLILVMFENKDKID